MSSVTYGHDVIDYAKIGDGPKTMVMIPGLGLKSVLGVADAVAGAYSAFSAYTIYLFDDREHVVDGYTIRDRADDIARQMKALGLKEACVFGTSMGGMVSQTLAVYYPELVGKLFITSTYSKPNPDAAEVMARWHELAAVETVDALIDDFAARVYSPQVMEAFGDAIKAGMQGATEDDVVKCRRLIEAIESFDIYDELDKITCPVCAVGTLGDRVLTVRGTREIAEKLGCESYIYGAEYGHAVYDETPDHGQRLLAFFDKEI